MPAEALKGPRSINAFPWAWSSEQDTIHWVRLPCEMARAAGFLDYRLDLSSCAEFETHWPYAMEETSPEVAFLVHSSLCASTLLARTLDIPGCCWVLREPWILRQLADWRRGVQKSPAIPTSADLSGSRVRRLLGLLKNYVGPEQTLAIKPTNVANVLILDLLRSGWSSPILVLTSSLRDFLAMAMKRADTLQKMPTLAKNLILDRCDHTRNSAFADIFHWLYQHGNDDPEVCAGLVWLLHMMEFDDFRRMANSAGQIRSLLVADLLSSPYDNVLMAGRHLGLDVREATLRVRIDGPIWHQHSKHPEFRFTPETRARIIALVLQENAQVVTRVEAIIHRWLDQGAALYLPENLVSSDRVSVRSLA